MPDITLVNLNLKFNQTWTYLVIVEDPLKVVEVGLGPVAELGLGPEVDPDLSDVPDQKILQDLKVNKIKLISRSTIWEMA